jgi:Heterokaryon incompatibility protein (HET)
VQIDAGSAITLDRAAAWVHNCVENHESCAAKIMTLPSRVLDLEGCINPRDIKLRETEGRLHGHYAALSHCWGRVGHFTTTSASMASRKEGIQIEELPKTFQDAVEIVRRIGIRYLWIDSLCICQDDVDDWACESAKMAAVYSNAYLTIAASHAPDSTAGCFNRRSINAYIPISFTAQDSTSRQVLVFLLPPGKEANSRIQLDLERDPLNKRAWALQERLMAQRVLHYGRDQMFFECIQEIVSEDGFYQLVRHCNLFQDAGFGSYNSIRSQHSASHGLWYSILEMYCRRKMSKPSDKLPAISGIARLLESRMQASYVAGLWSDALVEGLAWERVRRREGWEAPISQTYIAPSWSWASHSGDLMFRFANGSSRWRAIARALDYHIELKTQNPYGELKDGWIRIEAPLVSLSPSTELEKGDSSLKWGPRFKTTSGDPNGYYATLDDFHVDDDAARVFVNSLDFFALVLGRYDSRGREDEEKGESGQMKRNDEEAEDEDRNADVDAYICYFALIVAATSSDSGQMRRVGTIALDGKMYEGRSVFEDRNDFKTVVLV